jgi:hypothetical protein
MKFNWKIISIVLFVIIILQTSFVGVSFYLVHQYIQRDNQCQLDECFGYDFYAYDDVTGICSCYEQDGTLDKIVNLKYSNKSEEVKNNANH